MSSQRRRPEKGTEITLPITPMLDMSFQLLFFFISTFKLPTDPEGTLDLSMPSQATPMANDIAQADLSKKSADDKPDLNSYIFIKVENAKDDAALDEDVGDVTCDCKASKTKAETMSVDWRKGNYSMKELTDKLQSYIDEAKETQQTISGVKIQGASALKFKAVVHVMDACRKAGLKDISFEMPSDFDKYGRAHLSKD